VKERDNKLVLFDFDGTLNKKDSLFQFIAFYKGKLIKYFGLLVLSPVLIGVFFRLLSRHRAKELVISYFFKGEDELKFGNECRKFANNVLVKSLKPDALSVLNDYKKSRDRIIIISASMEYYISEIANLLGVDSIGTRMVFQNNKLTGKILGKNCRGPEKIKRLKEIVDLSSFNEIIAFGDSEGDGDLLEIATKSNYRIFK